jgi:hypothetical protein
VYPLASFVLASTVTWLGCGGGSGDITAPPTGALEVSTATTGPEPDADGYTVSIDGAAAVAIGANGSRRTDGLTTGGHTVQLSGVAANCTVAGGLTLDVEVTPNAVATATFAVACTPTTGSIQVTTSSTGTPADPDGYQLLLDGSVAQPIGPDATVTLSALTPGTHSVGLGGVAAGCTVEGDNPREVSVATGATAIVAVAVSCAPPAPPGMGAIGVTTRTTGPDQDADGYGVTLDGGDGRPIGVNATLALADLAPGPHTVGLTGIAANCRLAGDNPRAVAVASGTVAAVTFDVACDALPPSTGTLAVTTITTGTDLDPNGYTFEVDGGERQTIGANATVSLPGVAAGTRAVRLRGMAANCALGGENPRSVAVTAGGTAELTFALACTATTGGLTVTITGLPAGTEAAVGVTGPGGFSEAVPATRTLTGLVPGSYTIRAAQVTGDGTTYTATPVTRNVTVAAGATAEAAVEYAPAATATLNLRIDGWYLSQSVQSPAGDVPMVDNRDGYLRVFVLADQANTAAPAVRVRAYDGSALVRTFTIDPPAGSTPTSRNENDLGRSWNLKLPRELFVSGLRMVADVDPANAIAETDETDNSYPASGTPFAPAVRRVPVLGVRFVPVRQLASGLEGDVTDANRSGYLDVARRMYPLSGTDGDVHAVYTTSTSDPLQPGDGNGAWVRVLGEIDAMRVAEGTGRHYYGVVRLDYGAGIAGIGYIGFPTAMGYDIPSDRARVVAHELGHNWARLHAPCGGPSDVDPRYPYAGGAIGVYGINMRDEVLFPPDRSDIMGYCGNPWVSDYTYQAVLAWLAAAESARARAAAAAPQRCLLVWGRIVNGQPVLEPAFEIITRPHLPAAPGAWSVAGLAADGARLFSVSFDAAEIADGAGGDTRHFAWAIPLGAGTAARVGSLSLETPWGGAAAARAPAPAAAARAADVIEARAAGPGVALRWDAAAHPMIMVRDPDTGEVLSFARGGEAEVATRKAAVDLVMSDGVGSRTVRVAVGR